jgi:hypothetical protein
MILLKDNNAHLFNNSDLRSEVKILQFLITIACFLFFSSAFSWDAFDISSAVGCFVPETIDLCILLLVITKELETLIVKTKASSRNKALSMMKAGDGFTVEFDFKVVTSLGNSVEKLR